MLVSMFVFLFLSTALYAEDWSTEQKEVLSTIEACYEKLMERDLEGFLSYYHEDYKGWGLDVPVPYGKESVIKWSSFSFPRTEIMLYEVQPLEVILIGESAAIHYYFYYRFKNHEEKEISYTARWTDFYVKDGGKWLLIADHGGNTD
jgi:hypothetical protein